MNETKQHNQLYGAAFDDEGEIINIFPVSNDWEGYRFHGYCWSTEEEFNNFYSQQ
jgi:hypothetical protein